MGSHRDLMAPPQELDGAQKKNCIEGKGSREQPKGEEKDSKRIHKGTTNALQCPQREVWDKATNLRRHGTTRIDTGQTACYRNKEGSQPTRDWEPIAMNI